MITLPLLMRCSDKPRRQAGAWMIGGAEPGLWLDEMLAWGVPLDNAVLYLIPRSGRDLSPHGVLVVLPQLLQPKTTHRSQPFAAIKSPSEKHILYLPIEARFEPDASDSEAAALAAAASDCILHPTAGLIGLEASDRRRVADLLAPPVQHVGRWNLAEPGQHINSRLTAILAAEPPPLDEMIEQGGGDIGSESDDLGEIPRSSDEPSASPVARVARGVQRKLVDMLQKLTHRLTRSQRRRRNEDSKRTKTPQKSVRGDNISAKPGLLAKLTKWAQSKIRQLDEAMLRNRHRELYRLMRLLKEDPDRGLRFALPFWAEKHRGVVPPGDKLPEREIGFEFGTLGIGRDHWDMPRELHLQLRAKYLELAGREMRLGRYRRAAYIYAHLLGDFTNAAGALVAGKHWREAAAIYRERLKRPEEAARLLERGGLWAEAIELYQKLENHEKVGDLYAQLNQPEEAEKVWRLAVDRMLGLRDNTGAARLLETKLKSPDAALLYLARAWPDTPQAATCLAAQFALLARLGRHEAAQKRVEEIRAGEWPSDLRPRAIDRLADAATSYPHDAVRSAAADAVRTLAAGQLRTADAAALEHLLNSIRRLEPADRLLERDTARYQRQRAEPPVPRAKPPARTESLKSLGDFHLPGKFQWRRAVSCGGHFYVAGFDGFDLCLTQATWKGECRTQVRRVAKPAHLTLSFDPRGVTGVLHLLHSNRVPMIAFAVSDSVPHHCFVSSPAWIPNETVAVAHHATGTVHVVALGEDGIIVHRLNSGGTPLGSQLLDLDKIGGGAPYFVVKQTIDRLQPRARSAPIVARDVGLFLGIGWRLVLVAGQNDVQIFDLPDEVVGLCGSAPFSVGGVMATLGQGAALFWEDAQIIARFGDELTAPVGCFTTSGWIALASADKIQIYKTEGRKIQLAAQQERKGTPIAALPTAHPDGFAIVREDGVVEMYQMPRR